MLPMHPPSVAAEVAGNSTLLRLLLSHLHQQGMIEPALLAAMIEQAERSTWQSTPLLAESDVVSHTIAWLQTQD